MNIRRATSDDVAFMLSLAQASATAAHWSEQQYRDLFADLNDVKGFHHGGSQGKDFGGGDSIPQRLALVAEASAPDPRSGAASASQTLLGFLVARHIGPEWELENIVVAASARRRGVGKRLLEALLSAARETHSQAVFLEVRASNAAARALYEGAGFRETGRRKSYYKNPLEDAVLYLFVLG